MKLKAGRDGLNPGLDCSHCRPEEEETIVLLTFATNNCPHLSLYRVEFHWEFAFYDGRSVVFVFFSHLARLIEETKSVWAGIAPESE